MQTPTKPSQRPDVCIDRRPTQIVEQVVMHVIPVKSGGTRLNLVQVREVIVDKVRKGLGRVHAASALALYPFGREAHIQ
jgi:hypothetical protein